ncbi:MAG: 6-phosphogluconolactonase [Terriglobales bacterium]
MPSAPEIRILDDPAELFRAAAVEFSELANEAVHACGRFCVALSGGSTPKGLYTLLATGAFPVPWENVCVLWGDERHVPPDDPESNYRMANEAMLSKVPVPAGNVFRILGEEKDAQVAAKKYEETLVNFFDLDTGELPRFDLILLGMGPDGHTASLFPNSSALREKKRLVAANWVEKFHAYRITLTSPVLNNAVTVVFLVSGQDKSAVLHDVLDGPPGRFPSQLVHPAEGRMIWLLDRAAASKLSSADRS